ncbi:MAG: carbon-nitrogen hydrolase family protein [Candidatus Latescibacteria bacterium]|nr:carbon-nitrogen hydrolase family protein [Candidatus Latescibacterota bacterium]
MPRIALVQMRCEKAAIEQNLASIGRYLDEAAERWVDIVGLPEMSLTGYADPTRYPDAIIRLDGPEVARFVARTRGNPATVLVGLIEENPGAKPFITQLAARDGQVLGHYRKRTIENEEADWFSPGTPGPVFEQDGLTFGLSICADIGNEAVFADCAGKGARLVFELAAPGLYGEQASRNWATGYQWWEGECQKYLSRYARQYGIWIGVATQAGRTIDEDFPGGAFVFAPDGERVFATPDWREGAVYLDIDLESGRVMPI